MHRPLQTPAERKVDELMKINTKLRLSLRAMLDQFGDNEQYSANDSAIISQARKVYAEALAYT